MEPDSLLNIILILEERENLISSELESTKLTLSILANNLLKLNANILFLKKNALIISIEEFKKIKRDVILIDNTINDLRKRKCDFEKELDHLAKKLNKSYIDYDYLLECRENNLLIFRRKINGL